MWFQMNPFHNSDIIVFLILNPFLINFESHNAFISNSENPVTLLIISGLFEPFQ